MLVHACGQIAEEIFISSHLHGFTWALLTRSALSLGCDGNPQPQTDVLTTVSKSDHTPKVKTSLLFEKKKTATNFRNFHEQNLTALSNQNT
jgi:hypothetical protein